MFAKKIVFMTEKELISDCLSGPYKPWSKFRSNWQMVKGWACCL